MKHIYAHTQLFICENKTNIFIFARFGGALAVWCAWKSPFSLTLDSKNIDHTHRSIPHVRVEKRFVKAFFLLLWALEYANGYSADSIPESTRWSSHNSYLCKIVTITFHAVLRTGVSR